MSATTSSNWLYERADRSSLVTWLAVAAAKLGSPFLENALAALLESGRLSAAQERAVRRARARAVLAATRENPTEALDPAKRRKSSVLRVIDR